MFEHCGQTPSNQMQSFSTHNKQRKEEDEGVACGENRTTGRWSAENDYPHEPESESTAVAFFSLFPLFEPLVFAYFPQNAWTCVSLCEGV